MQSYELSLACMHSAFLNSDSMPARLTPLTDLAQRLQVWWRILKNAIAFESDDKMREHKATRGRTHTMAAPLENGLWRMERGDISQAGQTANKCASRASAYDLLTLLFCD
jgi:hypothetical protein